MTLISQFGPIDYLVIGHIAHDITPTGISLGGTAAYAALTARAIGLRVGMVTVGDTIKHQKLLSDIAIANAATDRTTTFENIEIDCSRIQIIHDVAPVITKNMIPTCWELTPIVHLAPIAQEVDPNMARLFEKSFIGLTPQGWLREWDFRGRVLHTEWPESRYVMEKAAAAVLSIDDINGDEDRIEDLASSIDVLVVTEGINGARVYWQGDIRNFRPPSILEVDPTGAGDIFACAFFARLYKTRDPWEAARFATLLSAMSVSRIGIKGIPNPDEVNNASIDIIHSR